MRTALLSEKTQQTKLKGGIVREYVYYVLGFVPADVVRLKNNVGFTKLDNEKIKSVEQIIDLRKKPEKIYRMNMYYLFINAFHFMYHDKNRGEKALRNLINLKIG
jgi:hypothetical protein